MAWNWSEAEKDMAVRVVEEGHKYISGQLALATSADQRAAALAGVFATAATALMAAGIVLVAEKIGGIGAATAIFVSAGGFLTGAFLCIRALMPIGIYIPGSEPTSWREDLENGRSLEDALHEEAEFLQEKIDENRTDISRNARLFKWGALSGLAAPALGFGVWAISLFSEAFYLQ